MAIQTQQNLLQLLLNTNSAEQQNSSLALDKSFNINDKAILVEEVDFAQIFNQTRNGVAHESGINVPLDGELLRLHPQNTGSTSALDGNFFPVGDIRGVTKEPGELSIPKKTDPTIQPVALPVEQIDLGGLDGTALQDKTTGILKTGRVGDGVGVDRIDIKEVGAKGHEALGQGVTEQSILKQNAGIEDDDGKQTNRRDIALGVSELFEEEFEDRENKRVTPVEQPNLNKKSPVNSLESPTPSSQLNSPEKEKSDANIVALLDREGSKIEISGQKTVSRSLDAAANLANSLNKESLKGSNKPSLSDGFISVFNADDDNKSDSASKDIVSKDMASKDLASKLESVLKNERMFKNEITPSGNNAKSQALLNLTDLNKANIQPGSILTAGDNTKIFSRLARLSDTHFQTPLEVLPSFSASAEAEAVDKVQTPKLGASSEFTQGLNLKQNFTPNLALRVQWMFKQALSSAEIMMDPPEMGPLSVKIQQHNGETNILFQVSHAATKDMLDDNLSKLREMLEQQGITLGDALVQHDNKQSKESKNSSEQQSADDSSETASKAPDLEDEQISTLGSDQILDVYS